MRIEQKLRDLGYELPPVMEPLAKYRWATRYGNLIHLAGHGPFVNRVPKWVGKIGRELTVEQGYEANRFVGLTMLATLEHELGDLDRVVRPIQQVNYVNLAPEAELGGYYHVGDGSVDLWIALWGDEIGRCARMTIPVIDLPEHVPTAITSTWEVRD